MVAIDTQRGVISRNRRSYRSNMQEGAVRHAIAGRGVIEMDGSERHTRERKAVVEVLRGARLGECGQ